MPQGRDIEANDAIIVPTVTTTTWNPADCHANITLSGGNLITTRSAAATASTAVRAVSNKSSGKYYYEVKCDVIAGGNDNGYGIATATFPLTAFVGADNNSISVLDNGGLIALNSAVVGTGPVINPGDTVGIAVDIGNKTIWFRKGSGIWNEDAGANPATNTGGVDFSVLGSGPFYPALNHNASTDKATTNFGATAYVATAPSGFSNW